MRAVRYGRHSGIDQLYIADIPAPDATPGHVAMQVEYTGINPDALSALSGADVIDTPGHSADHQSFLWHRHGGVMIVGDAVTNEDGKMDFTPFYDNLADELRSVEKLKGHAFEKMAFGHGDYIPHGARAAFLQRWGKLAE